MKVQIGVRVDSQLWSAYRVVCADEKLRPSEPIEGFLGLVFEYDSALSVLWLMRETIKARADGLEAYARVLLDWYVKGKNWIYGSYDKELSVEALLLDTLKAVSDADLRLQIEQALIDRKRKKP